MPPKNISKVIKKPIKKDAKKDVKKETKNTVKIESNIEIDNNSDESENNTKTIEQKYQKKTQIEHILLRPDTYIGDISIQSENMWIYDDINNKIINKEINYIPGLYKIFDEILVNARDHSCTDSTCDTIKVNIDKELGLITVWNNGTGIDVVKHIEHNMYIPEMLFGELLTSTNYDDTEKRTTGGRNGYGAKLTNVFSKFFSIETVDGPRKLKFYQEFTNNLSNRTEPKITDVKAEKPITYTKITFEPDLTKFKLKKLTDDIVSLMHKRVIDMAGITSKVKVYINDKKIDINNFKKYINLYKLNDNNESDDEDSDDEESESKNKSNDNIIYEEDNRWKIGVIYNPDGNFQQISFVNGICTYHGGNHVDYVLNQIIKKLEVIIQKKYNEAKIKQSTIKDNLTIFLDSVIDNPAFTSQTKETLKTKHQEFGSSYEPSEKLIKKLVSTGIVDQIINMAKLKEESFLKKTDGKKTTSIKGIPKLEDASWAGSKKSNLCKLILTEGDSAKALAMAGRSVIGSDSYGVFPLKGKLLNVRDASPKQLLENEEIINIKKILGLQHNKEYTDINDLRYGGIVLMCDQDVDGYHIKGLLMNFFHYFWPSLLQNHNFIYALATPIVKATKGSGKTKSIKVFYNLTDYSNWKDDSESKSYSIKYYKGLGTSTKEEAKEYFEDIEHKLIKYTWKNGNYNENDEDNEDNEDEKNNEETIDKNDTESNRDMIYKKIIGKSKKIFGVNNKYENDCTESLTLAFEKTRSNCRKVWLRNYNKNRILSNDQKDVPIPDFIHKEMIHFSNDDNNRSIPCIVDGLKPSTRKILYGAILRKLDKAKDEIKVAQLSGFVSDKTCYHHGEASLNGAIIGLAQNYIGSNNINILYPSGQFGSRMLGGKDFASPRYIFTYLAELTRLIFRPDDDSILNYLDDDGILVEPEWFCPIIPMLLVNGSEGIGTGFSTSIPQYNPIDIIDNLKLLINGKEPKSMIPYYRKFTGTIEQSESNKYMVKGIYQRINDDTIKISELPIGVWTTPYKEFLDKKTEKTKNKNPLIQSFKSSYTDETVDFTIKMDSDILDKIIQNGDIWKKLKLSKSISISNMHLYNVDGQIQKYNSVLEILNEFYNIRLMMYTKRKEYLIDKLSKELDILKYKKLFIEKVLDGSIIIYKQKKSDIIDRLIELKFPKLSKLSNEDCSYEYITEIPLFNLTQEKIDELNEKFNNKEQELKIIENTSEQDQWISELDELSKKYKDWNNLHSNLDKKVKKVIKDESKINIVSKSKNTIKK